ncbi:MAG: hypothetical protein LBT10_03660, partial [Methanobrevibacter sp.]|nr:hypothetical protein [Methanobrevibacter sp.]
MPKRNYYLLSNGILKKRKHNLFGTVKLAWIFTIEKLKTCAKSLITCICTKFFLLKTQIPDCG